VTEQMLGKWSATQNSERIVASLDRKRLGTDFCGGEGCRPEAFSMRRLGGSRWRGGRGSSGENYGDWMSVCGWVER